MDVLFFDKTIITFTAFHILPICKHLTNVVIIFYIKIRWMHLHKLTPLYSHCDTDTCFSPQRAILRKKWYISSAKSTKYVSWCKKQIKEQLSYWSILVTSVWCISLYIQQHIICSVTVTTLKQMLLFNLTFTSAHIVCWPTL